MEVLVKAESAHLQNNIAEEHLEYDGGGRTCETPGEFIKRLMNFALRLFL